jgi:hypothetical protein
MGNKSSKIFPFVDDEKCIICFEKLGKYRIFRPCKKCNIFYHSKCLNKWFSNNLDCPICHDKHNMNIHVTKNCLGTYYYYWIPLYYK